MNEPAATQPDGDYVYDDPEQASARKPRSRCCMGCCAALLVLMTLCCLGLGWVSNQLADPTLAEARLQELVPSTVPAGYQGNLSLELRGLLVAALAPEGSPPGQGTFTLLVVAVPPQAPSEVALAQLREGVLQNFQIRVDEASQVEVTVRGQRLMAEQVQGLTPAGIEIRIVFLAVARRADDPSLGDAILIAGGPVKDFDEVAWQAFLESIH